MALASFFRFASDPAVGDLALLVDEAHESEGLGALLTEERLEDWKAWLRFAIVHGAASFLSDDFVDENFAFTGTTLAGTPVNAQ